jgi:DNA-binding NtrC family response regulator/ABC-type nitrate/sulfonate/bicarbonate transport system substrate-binding protein
LSDRFTLNIPPQSDQAAIFADPASRAVQDLLDRLAPTDATLLIIGETGTGKEMAARYIHARSRRKSGPFLAVNCGALSDTLAEAELFGHEKGAFTGALRSERGWFEAASGGTLLLDEIGDLPLNLQVKLLRVLQEREVTRLGSRVAIPINVRVVAATNIDLHSAITEKRFREDLYFRLNVATIMLPPLRERQSGLPILIRHFLKLYGDRLGRPHITISAKATARLTCYSWPGNIRELENVIHNAVLLSESDVIESDHLQITETSTAPPVTEGETLETKLQALVEKAIQDKEPQLFDRLANITVQTAFDLAQANQLRAASFLGVSRNVLRTQLSHLGVIPGRRRSGTGPDDGPPAARGTGLRELRVGYQKFGILNLLRARETFEELLSTHGISLRWIEFPAGPQLLRAMAEGHVDFGSTGEVPPILAQSAGAPIVYAAYEPAVPQGVAVVVPRDSTIRNIIDLQGKRVKFNKGSNVHYLLIRALESNGMSLHDIDMVDATQDRGVFMNGNDADGWALWDPLLTIAQRSGEVRILFDGDGLVQNHQFHIVRRDFAETYPDILNTLLESIGQVGQQATSNPLATARAASTKIGIDVPTLEITFGRLTHGTQPMDQTIIWEQQKIADRFYALGLIPRAIAVREMIWKHLD